jgi:ferredoxin-nitrite reductase
MDFGLGGSLGTDNEFLDWVEHAVPARAVVPALQQLFDAFDDEREAGERFYEWTRRVSNDRLRQILQGADANVSGGVAYGD